MVAVFIESVGVIGSCGVKRTRTTKASSPVTVLTAAKLASPRKIQYGLWRYEHHSGQKQYVSIVKYKQGTTVHSARAGGVGSDGSHRRFELRLSSIPGELLRLLLDT